MENLVETQEDRDREYRHYAALPAELSPGQIEGLLLASRDTRRRVVPEGRIPGGTPICHYRHDKQRDKCDPDAADRPAAEPDLSAILRSAQGLEFDP